MVAGMCRDEFVAHSAQKAQTIGHAETALGKIPGVHSGLTPPMTCPGSPRFSKPPAA